MDNRSYFAGQILGGILARNKNTTIDASLACNAAWEIAGAMARRAEIRTAEPPLIVRLDPVRKTEAKTSFTPPSPDDIRMYFVSKGKDRNMATSFCDYYNSNGWMVGKNKMKDWQSAANQWISRDGGARAQSLMSYDEMVAHATQKKISAGGGSYQATRVNGEDKPRWKYLG